MTLKRKGKRREQGFLGGVGGIEKGTNKRREEGRERSPRGP